MVVDDDNSNKKTRRSYFNILKNKVHFAEPDAIFNIRSV